MRACTRPPAHAHARPRCIGGVADYPFTPFTPLGYGGLTPLRRRKRCKPPRLTPRGVGLTPQLSGASAVRGRAAITSGEENHKGIELWASIK